MSSPPGLTRSPELEAANTCSFAAGSTIIIGCAAALTYAALCLSAGPDNILLGMACLSSVVICVFPIWLQRDRDIFQPMLYIFGLTLIAMPLRHAYLILAPNDVEASRLTNGQPPAFFIAGALMINVALLSLVGGWLCTTYRLKVERIGLFRSRSWRTPLFWPVTILLVGISAVAFLKFVTLTGFEFSDVTRLSRKRSVEGATVPVGYLVWAIELARYMFFVTITYFLSRRGRLTGTNQLILLALAVAAMASPFFTSSRSGILIVALVGLTIYVYMGGRLSLIKATLLMVPIVGLTMIITMFRGPGAEWTGWREVFDPVSLLRTVAGAFNFGGFVALSHVMNSVRPEDYTLGSTLTFWTYAWIPRSMWPDKPLEVGYILLDKILQFRGNLDTRHGGGAAAGLPAELYLNFGPYLLPIGMFLYGSCIRIVYNSLRPLAHASPVAAVLAATLGFTLTYGAYGFSLSRGMILSLKEMTMLIIIFLILLRSK